MSLLSRHVIVLALCLSGCSTQVTRPDGSIERQAVDLDMVRLMASASVASWAAATNGIKQDDANAVMTIMNTIDAYHADGTAIDPAGWAKAIQRDVPVRYQGLAMVMVEITAYQLKKYDLSTVVPLPDSPAGQIMQAIRDGVKLGLLPYLNNKPA